MLTTSAVALSVLRPNDRRLAAWLELDHELTKQGLPQLRYSEFREIWEQAKAHANKLSRTRLREEARKAISRKALEAGR